MQNPEILIVGAGPVGLTLAVECARRGLSFRIIDASPRPSDRSKALAIWSAAQEVFSAIGVLETMRAEALVPTALTVSNRQKDLFRVPAGEFVDSPFPELLILPQSETERILLDRLAALGHRVERPIEFVSLEDSGDGVRAKLSLPDGAEEFVESRFLVGCDGAHSAVRHAVGVRFEGRALAECFVLCDAEVTGPVPLAQDLYVFLSRWGMLPMFPIRDRVWRVVSTRDRNSGSAEPTLEEMQDHLDKRGPGGLRLSNPEWLSCFRVSERKADKFRCGNVLLAGDAAHIHSPAGGQGMNTGIQDAFNLGWKLECILRAGCLREILLESYHAERAPVAAHIIAEASLRTRIAGITGGPVAAARNFFAKLAGKSEHAKGAFAIGLSGTDIRYRKSPILPKDSAWHEDWIGHGFVPGMRVRDAVVEGDGAPVSLLASAMGASKHTLLLFSGKCPNFRDADQLDAIRESAAGSSSLLSAVSVWRGESAPDESWLLDRSGEAHRRFGADLPSLYLIRPDGVVASRSQPADYASVAKVVGLLRKP